MINFEDAMWKCSTAMNSSERWKVMETLYNDNFLTYTGDKTPKIPKILHQIWLGSPFPDKYRILTDRWKEKHPDWTVMLWTEQEIEEFGLVNKWMYDNMRNPSAKSDVVRYEIAYSYGGVYLDTDFYCCKSLDDLLYLDFFCGINGSYNGSLVSADTCLAQCIFGVSQGHDLMAQIIRDINKITQVPRSIPEIMEITGPGMFSRKISSELGKHPMSVIFPPNYFYPFPGQNRMDIRNISFSETQKFLERYTYPETYAMHLWYCSWQKAELLG